MPQPQPSPPTINTPTTPHTHYHSILMRQNTQVHSNPRKGCFSLPTFLLSGPGHQLLARVSGTKVGLPLPQGQPWPVSVCCRLVRRDQVEPRWKFSLPPKTQCKESKAVKPKTAIILCCLPKNTSDWVFRTSNFSDRQNTPSKWSSWVFLALGTPPFPRGQPTYSSGHQSVTDYRGRNC